jgi:hypothetical protein
MIDSKVNKTVYESIVNLKPLNLMQEHSILTEQSNMLANDLCLNSTFSHFDSKKMNFDDRIKSINQNKLNLKGIKESIITFDDDKTLSVILKILSDSEVTNKINRKNLLHESAKYFGLATHSHKIYKNILVITYADEII